MRKRRNDEIIRWGMSQHPGHVVVVRLGNETTCLKRVCSCLTFDDIRISGLKYPIAMCFQIVDHSEVAVIDQEAKLHYPFGCQTEFSCSRIQIDLSKKLLYVTEIPGAGGGIETDVNKDFIICLNSPGMRRACWREVRRWGMFDHSLTSAMRWRKVSLYTRASSCVVSSWNLVAFRDYQAKLRRYGWRGRKPVMYSSLILETLYQPSQRSLFGLYTRVWQLIGLGCTLETSEPLLMRTASRSWRIKKCLNTSDVAFRCALALANV